MNKAPQTRLSNPVVVESLVGSKLSVLDGKIELEYAASIDLNISSTIPSLRIHGAIQNGRDIDLLFRVRRDVRIAPKEAREVSGKILEALKELIAERGLSYNEQRFILNQVTIETLITSRYKTWGQIFDNITARLAVVQQSNGMILELFVRPTAPLSERFHKNAGGIKGNFELGKVKGAWVLRSDSFHVASCPFNKDELLRDLTKLFTETFPFSKGIFKLKNSLLPEGFTLVSALTSDHVQKSKKEQPRKEGEQEAAPAEETAAGLKTSGFENLKNSIMTRMESGDEQPAEPIEPVEVAEELPKAASPEDAGDDAPPPEDILTDVGGEGAEKQ